MVRSSHRYPVMRRYTLRLGADGEHLARGSARLGKLDTTGTDGKEHAGRRRRIQRVTPTLTLYLPEPSKATGTGVIIAPGGAFVALAIELEGHEVALWLQQRGIAAFVLKYRIWRNAEKGCPRTSISTRSASTASPMAYRPSKLCDSTPRSGTSLRTASGFWVSRQAPW